MPPNTKKLGVITSLGLAAGIGLGAIGAHTLRPHLTDIQFNSYETGIRYLFYHLISVLILLHFAHTSRNTIFLLASKIMLIGTLLFSGSILLLSTKDLSGIRLQSFWGLITPLGGLVLIASWCIVAWGYFNEES